LGRNSLGQQGLYTALSCIEIMKEPVTLIEKSLHIALQAYSGKTDKAGRPYVLHPLRLMARMESDDERAVALLHDVIEDSEFTAIPLREAGIPLRIVVAVQCLTRLDRESYEKFIQRVLTNKLAVKVKMADIEDNLNVLRLKTLGDNDLERVRKYHAAWKMLDGRG
jgi:(p)ppGpp synthase/HD superfamily hydrolase